VQPDIDALKIKDAPQRLLDAPGIAEVDQDQVGAIVEIQDLLPKITKQFGTNAGRERCDLARIDQAGQGVSQFFTGCDAILTLREEFCDRGRKDFDDFQKDVAIEFRYAAQQVGQGCKRRRRAHDADAAVQRDIAGRLVSALFPDLVGQESVATEDCDGDASAISTKSFHAIGDERVERPEHGSNHGEPEFEQG
jgi:hypothetical protein